MKPKEYMGSLFGDALKLWPIWIALSGAYGGHLLAQYRISQLENAKEKLESKVDALEKWQAEIRGRFAARSDRSRGR